MAPRTRPKVRRTASLSDSAVAPKVNNLAAGPPKSTVVAPDPSPSTKAAAVVVAPAASPKSTSPQPSTPPKADSPPPAPKVPSVEPKTTPVSTASPATTKTSKKGHATTAAVEVKGGKQQPVEAPAAVTFGSTPPTTLTDIHPSTLSKGASQATTSLLVAGAGVSSSTLRSTGPAKQVPSLANPAGANNNNNNPSPSASVIGAGATSGRPHVNGTPTSTILAISIVLVLVLVGIIAFVVRRRVKAEERLVLGAGGRGGDGSSGGVKRGWKTLDEDGGGQFADDLKTDRGLGGGASEMVMSDGASFVWSGQGYRGADVEEQERQQQDRSYWEQQQAHGQDGYGDGSRETSFYPPTPPRLYAAQMAPPPTRPPRPEGGSARQPANHPPAASSGVRNLYAPNAHQAGARPGQPYQPPPQPSYSSASSLHPSHAVTHHPPVQTRSKGAAGGSGGSRDLLRQNVGQMNQKEAEVDARAQGGQDRASGSFGSLMMLGYDEEGSMTPLPTHPLSPTFLPYHQDDPNSAFPPKKNQQNDTLAVDGFVPLSQMAFERTETKYRSPIESIFETYEGVDERASYVYT